MANQIQNKVPQPLDSKVHLVNGVQVYGRSDAQGGFRNLDAIATDAAKIREIADHLQRQGFGVMREYRIRGGKLLYLCNATWAQSGEPPERPFDRD